MSEGKHAPTPWKVFDVSSKLTITYKYTIYTDPVNCALSFRVVGRISGGTPSEEKANAEFIVKACNSYDQDQETIKALVEACEALMADFDPDSEYYQKIYVQGMTALALAKKKGE